MDNRTVRTFAIIAVLVIVALLLSSRSKPSTQDTQFLQMDQMPQMAQVSDKIKVYGSMGCGWTTKQLNYLKDRADFIDCDKGGCPAFVSGFPTLEEPNGKITVGYNEI